MKKFLTAAFFAVSFCTFATADDLDDLFADPESSVIEEAVVVENPEASIFDDTGSFLWAGDFTGSSTVRFGHAELPSSADDLVNPTERLAFDLGGRLWFDARPDRNFRVFGKFTADYPFGTEIQSLANPALPFNAETNPIQTNTLNSIRVFELFSDFNWDEKVFFRFGKQTAGWGLSRFYQIADPLSVGVKDPSDPAADLEGPLALKAALPLGVNNLYFYSVVKESYLPANTLETSMRDVGLGIKADFLVPVPDNKFVGNGEFTLGAFTQRHLAPKAVAGFSTGVGDFQIFTDQVLSWGLDSYRLTADGTATEKPDDGLFWSATLGTMYVNNDRHFTLYGEYMFNSAASDDPEYFEKWSDRFEMERADPANATLAFSDAFGYLSRHNSGLSLSFSELFGTDKLGFDALWLQNWVDRSGMITPSVTVKPFDHFSVESGFTVVWGKDRSEWVVKNMDPASDPANPVLRRFSYFISVKLGGGKF